MSTRAERAALRLWHSVRLPEDASTILSGPRFHTEAFCRLFLDGCDELLFSSPSEGLVAARVAPPLVLKLPPSHARNDLQVWALALLGGAHRACGNLFEAASTYPLAFEVADRERLSPPILGDLFRRYSILLTDQGRFPESEQMVRKAIDVLDPLPAGEGEFCLGAAILQRGSLRLHQEHFAEAIDDFGLALGMLDPKRNRRSYYAAAHNLAAALALAPDLDYVNQATRWLRHARSLQKGQRSSLARFKLYCIEAEVLEKVGSTRRAEKNLQIARKGFERIGAVHELALVSLQIILLLHGDGRFEELRQITDETVALCRQKGLDAEALALLVHWQKVTHEGLFSLPMLETLAHSLRRLLERHELTS